MDLGETVGKILIFCNVPQQALDALTISPFLVIDDKLVEVFNGKEVCEIVKDSVLSS